MKLLL